MDEAQRRIVVRHAMKSDVGLHREGNEDSAYAGPWLLAIADGMGGHAGGEVASAAAIDALAPLDAERPPGELLEVLAEAVHEASNAMRDIVAGDAALRGMGTTLTALLWSGTQAGLVHIGDSRAYRVRDGEVTQLTRDHTMVQSLVDDGRLSAEEVASHPQRFLLLRALGDGRSEPDYELLETRPGDRYLLSSDGLHDIADPGDLARVLITMADPAQAVTELIALAIAGGGPDNITCIVADVASAGDTIPS